jgi:hypothetical protein
MIANPVKLIEMGTIGIDQDSAEPGMIVIPHRGFGADGLCGRRVTR